MIQTSPSMRILVVVAPVDFRRGIDGLAAICRQQLQQDPMNGWAFVFRNRRATAVKILVYDGQGFWLCQKRLSQWRFSWWPSNDSANSHFLQSHPLHVLLSGGNPEAADVPIDRTPLYPRAWRSPQTQCACWRSSFPSPSAIDSIPRMSREIGGKDDHHGFSRVPLRSPQKTSCRGR
ncbi:MAG: IS66 family insertion sequence element accessory protein TnpB [Rhodopirellula sp.]|nr:IS66 family insertion sequence element accessory protein TnpB [Rhodopirellula sp.]